MDYLKYVTYLTAAIATIAFLGGIATGWITPEGTLVATGSVSTVTSALLGTTTRLGAQHAARTHSLSARLDRIEDQLETHGTHRYIEGYLQGVTDRPA